MAETLKKLVVNLIIWLAFAGVLLAFNSLAPEAQHGELNAVVALKRLIEPTLVLLQITGAVLLLGVLAIASEIFSRFIDTGTSKGLLRLSIDEAGSILTNYASLLVAAGLVTRSGLPAFATALAAYGLAYVLLIRPKMPPKQQRWTASYPDIEGVDEEVSLNVTGEAVQGHIKPVAGPDVGRTYQVSGSSRDRMLVGYFDSTTDGTRDKGAFALVLDNRGTYDGHVVYTHDTGELICERWVWQRSR